MSIFDVHEDIRKARTLAADFYTDVRYFELSKESLFERSWQFAGTTQEVDNLRPFDLLDGFLGVPLLLSRQNGADIICISNVCTHRGKILVEEPCNADLIRCGYHGRRFSTDGKFLSMPEFESVADFPSKADDLARVPVGRWGELLFVALDPVMPFDEYIADVKPSIDIHQYADAKLTHTTTYKVDAHWALYCENYVEGFHLPYVHKSLNAIVDYGSYTTEAFRHASMQIGRGKDGEVAAQYLFIFPNLMLNFYPWGISVNVVRPISDSRTEIDFLTYVSDPSKVGKGAGEDLHAVELEDEAVVESVQRGIRSRFYTHGRYSPDREQGTHHFHRLICEFMKN